jgi:hypothetical protein
MDEVRQRLLEAAAGGDLDSMLVLADWHEDRGEDLDAEFWRFVRRWKFVPYSAGKGRVKWDRASLSRKKGQGTVSSELYVWMVDNAVACGMRVERVPYTRTQIFSRTFDSKAAALDALSAAWKHWRPQVSLEKFEEWAVRFKKRNP